MGNETDISGFGTQGSQIPVPAGAPTEVGETIPLSGPPAPTISTIKKSDMEKLAEALFIAAFPFLQPPESSVKFQDLSDPNALGIHGSSVISFSRQLDQLYHNIIIDMWDKYSETLKEIAKRREEDYLEKWGKDLTREGPKSAAEYNAYLMAITPTQRADETGKSGDDGLSIQFGATYNQWFVHPAENGITPTGSYPDSRFISGAIASAPDLVSQTIGVAGAVGLQMSVNPVADALTSLGPVSALPMDSQLATALVAALLYNGSMNKANYEALTDSANQSQPLTTVNFAINYAKNILAIVTHNVEGDEPTSARAGENRLIKLMLATTALALLHREVFDGVSPEELRDLIETNNIDKSKIPQETKDLFKSLAAAVNELLNQSPETREAMIAQMAQYGNHKESIESMLKSTKLLIATLDTSSITSGRLAAKQG